MIELTYKEILVAALLVVLIVFVLYLIAVLRKLFPILQNLKVITDDAAEITASAKESAEELKLVVDDAKACTTKLTSSVGGVCNLINGNKHTISAVTSLANASASIAKLFKK